MGLFEPIWKTRLFHTDKEKKAVEYVRRLTSPEKLLEISLSAPSLDVRKAAVEGLGEEKLLLEAALRTDSYIVADAAVRRLDDQEFLKELLLRGSDNIPFDKAAKKITGDAALAEIASRAVSRKARECAVREIGDLPLLSDFFKTPDAAVRHAAMETFRSLWEEKYPEGTKTAENEVLNGRFVDALIAEEDNDYPCSLPPRIEESDLVRIYRNAAREDLRAEAFALLVCRCPAEDLVKYFKEECIKPRPDDSVQPIWSKASGNLVNRILTGERNNTGLLMSFVRDPDTGFEMAARCIGLLFSGDLDGTDGIGKLRHESVETYFDSIPYWAGKSLVYTLESLEKIAVRTLGIMLPSHAREQCGFEVETRDLSGEDGFGRYSSSVTTVIYKGKRY